MAGRHKDKRTGIYVVQFYDPARTPRRKQATCVSRGLRVAGRQHRRWEGAYAEGWSASASTAPTLCAIGSSPLEVEPGARSARVAAALQPRP